MKGICAVLLISFSAAFSYAEAVNPLGQTIELLDDLASKMKAEAAASAAAAEEYATWCRRKLRDVTSAIGEGEKEKDQLEAAIAKMISKIEAEMSTIESLSAQLVQSEGELKQAEGIRANEAAEFKASEGELMGSIDMVTKAIVIIANEIKKSPGFLQVDPTNITSMIQSLSVVVDAAAFPMGDRKKLMALVQSQHTAAAQSDDDDDAMGAPSVAAYKSKSKNILDVLDDLKEKAEEELAGLRKAELTSKHSFDLLKLSLVDAVEADSKAMAKSKARLAAAKEAKSSDEGDLTDTLKTLDNDKDTKASTEMKCNTIAADQEASSKGFADELKVLAQAMEILHETTAPAAAHVYGFLQTDSSFRLVRKGKSNSETEVEQKVRSHVSLAGVEIVDLVKQLAKKSQSTALSQLASKIAVVFKFGAQGGEDPFAKVKMLISDMIEKLESQNAEDGDQKAYCETELAKTEAKKEDLQAKIDAFTSKFDSSIAKSAQLKVAIQDLQAELAEMASAQAEAGKIRKLTHEEYLKSKKELEEGLAGVEKALTVLRDFYGDASFTQRSAQPAVPGTYTKGSGSGTSIVEILEVVKSDFAKSLAEGEAQETDAASAFEQSTQENQVGTVTKEQAVKYKAKEYAALNKEIQQVGADKDEVLEQLSAVIDYLSKVKKKCTIEPETYEERKRRREAEIEGLKQAVQILETETVFIQRSKRGHKGSFLGL